MALTTQQTAQLAVFKTKPIGEDGHLVIGWQQALQQVFENQSNAPKAYTLTHAQRLTLFTANVTIGSMVFETDTNHVLVWNGKAWQQLV